MSKKGKVVIKFWCVYSEIYIDNGWYGVDMEGDIILIQDHGWYGVDSFQVDVISQGIEPHFYIGDKRIG